MTTKTIIPLVTFISGDPMQPVQSEPGDILVIGDQEATDWVARKFAQFKSNDQYGSMGTIDDTPLDAIVDAIAELPSTGYGKDGKPNVKALQNILEVEVTAMQRDDAWTRFQQLRDA